ncbi:glycine--tRNA ligase subunit beta [Alteraurantiacibacter palmitatis]|uniref:Glycine--tRNA ligase beta subunit n=1 Tax=Alteraurantiacibacter palmitatis TaxID=2054628 RepID=A0ABV7E3F4_9SPHN
MTDFLLELRCEEIPARMQAGARAELEKLFRAQMAAAGVRFGGLTVWSTPRRLALIARDLPETTEAVREETKGPRAGAPPQALEGFLRKTGLSADQLVERDGVLFAVVDKPGRAVKDVLAEAIPAIIRSFSWPKSMRWGAASLSTESLRWVRPLSGIVAILGEDLVECEVDGIASGYATHGHRFHCPGEITIGSAADYQDKLRACHVIVDHEERQDAIRTAARAVAEAEGLVLVEDEGLVIENAGLTEWPVPLLGRFDEAFLDVPPEVIQLTARVNQKYFVCESPLPLAGGAGGGPDGVTSDLPTPNPSRKREGNTLANAFVCTANIAAVDPAVVVDGNRKVLAARLSDARFFWEQDQKKTLAEHAEKLARITFHEKLGTVADKVERVAKLARWLCEEGIVKGDPALAEQAARLCKADLVTEMVGEFPELQGLMGGYYARAEGLPDAVADAIRDHYKPVGQGDDVPTAPVTVAVSLADKLDTIAVFLGVGLKPTGSKDPYALRRAAIGTTQIILNSVLRFSLLEIFFYAFTNYLEQNAEKIEHHVEKMNELTQSMQWMSNRISDTEAPRKQLQVAVLLLLEELHSLPSSVDDEREPPSIDQRVKNFSASILDFFADRLKVQQREAGVRHDLIDAVFALGGEDDLVRLLARVHALQAFIRTQDGANLLAGYKRAANILKKEDWQGVEGEIAQTGEEDPLAGVDDPLVADAVREKMAMRHARTYTPEPAEAALIAALDRAQPQAASAIAAEDFTAAMAALATLRGPIDAFFESVTVNDADPAKRAARLALLARFRAAVHNVADFSRIEG